MPDSATAHEPLEAVVLDALAAVLGGRLSTQRALLDQHAEDESFHPPHPPQAVAFPRTTEEVSQVVKICAAHAVPIIPFGAGTSLEGHVHALRGGVSISLSGMKAVLRVDPEDMDCRVQAGLTRKELDRHLKGSGLFFPVDPGADATLGGMTATGASGTTTVRYGAMRQNVLGLTVVLPDGGVIRTGGRARKSSAGYDLTRLFVGSEGTLGVITEVALRLHGVPESVAAVVWSFPALSEAVQAVILTIQMGVPIARVELLDEVQMEALNRFAGLDYPMQPTLFFEFHGSPAAVTEHADAVEEISSELGGSGSARATLLEDRNALWAARHEAYYASLALRPGSRGWPTDVCVPISRLAECILETRRDIDGEGLLAPIVGHVGDGNFHVLFVVDPDDALEMERARRVNERMIRRAIEMGGTCTGEHGVGYGKSAFLELEHGAAVSVMRSIKRTLDPLGLMNPGKIFAQERSPAP